MSSISKGQLQRTRCDGVRANVDLYRIRYGDAHIRYHQGANKNQCVWGPHDSWSYPSQGRPRQDHPWACQHHGGHLLMTHGPLFVCAVSSVLKYRSPCTEEIQAANAFFLLQLKIVKTWRCRPSEVRDDIPGTCYQCPITLMFVSYRELCRSVR